MTFQVKRLNRVDLDHYKASNEQLTSLVPGINHLYSVGSKPLQTGAISDFYTKASTYEREKGRIFPFNPAPNSVQFAPPAGVYSARTSSNPMVQTRSLNKSVSQSKLVDKSSFDSARYGGSHTPRASRQATSGFLKNPIIQPVDAGIENRYVKHQVSEYY